MIRLGAAIGAYLYLSAGIGEVALGGGFVALRPLQILGSGPLLGLVGTVEGLYFVLDFEFEGQPFVFRSLILRTVASRSSFAAA